MMLRRKRERALISVCSLLALFAVASCRAQTDSPAPANTAAETVVSSTPPFQTKEPDRYHATRTITTVQANGETGVTKTSTARDGEMRRSESEMGSRKMVYLELPEGRFVLLPDEKIYADLGDEATPAITEDEELSPEGLLHADESQTSFQKLETVSISGRKANKYRVVVNNSKTASVSLSVTLIWIDEGLGMAVRSETKSSDGTVVTMELSEIEFNVDKSLFQVPGDYVKVALSELRKRLIN